MSFNYFIYMLSEITKCCPKDVSMIRQIRLAT